MKTVIKQVKTIDGKRQDILIEKDRILKIADQIEEEARIISVSDDVYVSSGWIDLHSHCYEGLDLYTSDPDQIGIETAVTTVVDAGSCGADNIGDFYERSQNKKTDIFAFINVSKTGIVAQDELSDLKRIQKEAIEEAIEKYPGFIVGIKARMSQSVIGENGLKPLIMAKEIARELKLPVMVHIGSAPPRLEEILDELDAGDIVTHIYNGKANGILREDRIADFAFEAKRRGIYFDMGHGTDSFNFEVGEKAMEAKLYLDTISTDIYERNRVNGPVYDLATTMNKALYLGYDLDEVIRMVTEKPAEILGLEKRGLLKEGYKADLSFFKVEEQAMDLIDSNGNRRKQSQNIQAVGVFKDGQYRPI